ncbi:ATP-grasp domain-containing protein [Thiomonas sp.]
MNAARQKAHLARWADLFPEYLESETIDFEDFWEPASEVLALLDQKVHVWLLDKEARRHPVGTTPVEPDGRQPTVVMGQFPALRQPRSPTPLAPWWSSYLDREPVWPDSGQIEQAIAYALLPEFQQRAGRKLWLAGIPAADSGSPRFDRWIGGKADPDAISVAETLLEAHRQGLRKVFLKINLAKYQTKALALPDTLDRAGAERLVFDTLGFTIAHLEGFGNVVLVQEWVDLRKEYRCIVIDGRIVSGAGLIPAFTPLDRRTDDVWDRQVLGRQEDNEPVLMLLDTEWSQLQRFAEETAQAMAKRHGLRHYTLDLAFVGGSPCVVEVNPPYNFGLYANDPARVTKAILALD